MDKEIIDSAKEKMSKEAVKAMEGRNGWNTVDKIPRKLKTLSYDLYSRNHCTLCGASGNLHLHHTAPEVKEYLRAYNLRGNDEVNDLDPYQDTEPWQLVPLCESCHRKIENTNFSMMNRLLWWIALQKAEEYSDSLESYLEERKVDIQNHYRTPLSLK